MEQENIWEYYQTEAKSGFKANAGRLDYVAKLVGGAEKTLTIGVGDLYLESKLHANSRDIYILDPGQKTIDHARAALRLPENKAKVGYSQRIPYADAMFDCVVMSEVLEHLNDEVLNATIGEVFRVLRPKGKFIGTVPYNEDIKAAQVMCPHCSEVFHRVGHVQSFTAKRIQGLLRTAFRNDAVTVTTKYLPTLKILNWKGKLVALTIKFLELFRVYSSRANLVFQAVK